MDPVTAAASDVELVTLARALVDIDSTTGREADAGHWLASYLRAHGFSVIEQPVDALLVSNTLTGASATPGAYHGSSDYPHFDLSLNSTLHTLKSGSH